MSNHSYHGALFGGRAQEKSRAYEAAMLLAGVK